MRNPQPRLKGGIPHCQSLVRYALLLFVAIVRNGSSVMTATLRCGTCVGILALSVACSNADRPTAPSPLLTPAASTSPQPDSLRAGALATRMGGFGRLFVDGRCCERVWQRLGRVQIT